MKLIILALLVLASLPALSQPSFVIYDRWSDAVNGRNKIISELKLKNRGEITPRANMLLDYKRVEELTVFVMNEFRRQYPEETKNLTTDPFVLINNARSITPGTAYIPKSGKLYLIEFSGDILHSSIDTIIPIIAHELAHLILQSLGDKKNKPFPIERYYDSTSVSVKDSIESKIPYNKELSGKLKIWHMYSSYAGTETSDILGGITYSKSWKNPYSHINLLHQVINKISNKSYECKSFIEHYNSFQKYIRSITEKNNLSKINPPYLEKILFNRTILEKQLKNCLNFKINLKMEMAEQLESTYEAIDVLLKRIIAKKDEKAEFTELTLEYFETYNAGEAFIKISSAARKNMRTIEKEIGFSKIRRYTREDHADEIAVKILKKLNISQEKMFLFIQKIDGSFFEECSKTPTEEPLYGPLDHRHHSTCWRWWRSSKL